MTNPPNDDSATSETSTEHDNNIAEGKAPSRNVGGSQLSKCNL